MPEAKLNLEVVAERDMLRHNLLDEEIRGIILVEPLGSIQKDSRPGVDMVFLLDSSDSMDDSFYNSGKTKKQIVVDAAKQAASLLGNRDTISVISFNSTAVLMLDHEYKSDIRKIDEKIEGILNHSGQTNFEAAIRLAESVCKKKPNKNTKIVFLTDGNQNIGDSSKALANAKKIVEEGATIDAMGIGGDFNLAVMREYSAISGGITENIVAVEKTAILFRQILKAGQSAAVVNAHLNVHFEKGIRDIKVYQSFPEKRVYSGSVTVLDGRSYIGLNIGDLPFKGSKQFAVSCRVDLPEAENKKLADLNVSYTDPVSGDSSSKDLQWLISLTDAEDSVLYDSRVTGCFMEIDLLIDFENAIVDYNEGNLREAVKRLERCVENARSRGKDDEMEMYGNFAASIRANERIDQERWNQMIHSSSQGTERIPGQQGNRGGGRVRG